MKSLPTERMFHGSITMEDGIYIVGGIRNDEISKLNPSTESFENVALLEEHQNSFGICTLDNESFIFAGGLDDSDPRDTVETSYIFNTNTDTLKKVGNLNTERHGLALVKSEDEDIYAIGGGDEKMNCLNTIEKFDKKSLKWKDFSTKLKTARRYFQAVAYKNFIYIIGGELNNRTITNSIEKFDTITKEIKFIKTKLNIGRSEFAAAKFKNLVYILGGSVHSSTANTVEVFNLDLEEIKEGENFKNADDSFTANIF